MNREKNFKDKSTRIHKGIYNYDKVEYVNAKTKVTITCKLHGDFQQTPDRHSQGSGCQKCAVERVTESKRLTTETFISEAKKVHKNTYTYDKVNYTDSVTKVTITCKEHGDFLQRPAEHLQGKRCKKCAVEKAAVKNTFNNEKFIAKAIKVHGDKYDYSKVDYKNAKTSITIICKEHGEFEQKPYHHTQGSGCKECGRERSEKAKLKTNLEYIKDLKELYGDIYNYSKVNFTGHKSKVTVTCKKHGDFTKPANYLFIQKQGCPKCIDEKIRSNTEDFIKKSKIKHGDLYDYTKVDYKDSKTHVTIICPDHGEFQQVPNGHLNGNECTFCTHTTSKAEIEIAEFLKQYTEVEQSNRQILKGKEFDIYLPNEKVAIEYNGLYWHSDLFRDRNYHLSKTKESELKGIKLIHVFEDEWISKKEIVKSRLLSIIGKVDNRIYARKTTVKEVPTKLAMKFLEENHIQGKVGGQLKLGLYKDTELVALMTFGKLRKILGQESKEGSFELLRFCNKKNTTVVGGASKLFKHFLKNYKPIEVISYADRRWSNGNLYNQIGFQKVQDTVPNYFYVIRGVRENRFKYRKSELVKEGYDSTKTEKQIMKDRGFNRIYDCGTMKFKFIA